MEEGEKVDENNWKQMHDELQIKYYDLEKQLLTQQTAMKKEKAILGQQVELLEVQMKEYKERYIYIHIYIYIFIYTNIT